MMPRANQCYFRLRDSQRGRQTQKHQHNAENVKTTVKNSRIRFTVGVTLPHGDGHNQIPELLVFEDLFVLCLHADVSPMRAARLLLRGPGAETHDSNQLKLSDVNVDVLPHGSRRTNRRTAALCDCEMGRW
ncbi:hypothetical protein F2P81_002698 [Scophthalmus maximus]|uniref:Uncharacterized protein n=1 Tax=Scophthalmus maximus TaxID=52904 RepID=A0A6A4TMV5_SCOMX|nr:hypothetical protein F2P81_002698 [Scophthalmus maximus]